MRKWEGNWVGGFFVKGCVVWELDLGVWYGERLGWSVEFVVCWGISWYLGWCLRLVIEFRGVWSGRRCIVLSVDFEVYLGGWWFVESFNSCCCWVNVLWVLIYCVRRILKSFCSVELNVFLMLLFVRERFLLFGLRISCGRCFLLWVW